MEKTLMNDRINLNKLPTQRENNNFTMSNRIPPNADDAAVAVAVGASSQHAAVTAQDPDRSQVNAAFSSNGNDDLDDDEEELAQRKYGAEHVIKLFIPVSICMLLVVLVVKTIEFYTRKDGGFLIYTPFQENTDDSVTKLWMSVANMLIFITVVAVMTFVLFFLFKYRCYRFLHGWLVFSSITILFMFLFIFFAEILEAYNMTVDYITLALVMWNVAMVGILTIHWRGPLLLQQAYLILVSVLMALIFIKYLPDWTTWTILVGISVWDLVAVLTTCGPLRKLVELAQQRNESIFPSLIYTSGVMYMIVGVGVGATDENNTTATNGNNSNASDGQRQILRGRRRVSASNNNNNNGSGAHLQRQADLAENSRSAVGEASGDVLTRLDEDDAANLPEFEQGDDGIKLGLGDFIFYSVLVGKASSKSDWTTIVACYVAILIGLCLTLVLLAVHQRALPALPISLSLGLIFYFLTSLVMKPFLDELAINQVFV